MSNPFELLIEAAEKLYDFWDMLEPFKKAKEASASSRTQEATCQNPTLQHFTQSESDVAHTPSWQQRLAREQERDNSTPHL